jgi:hypothetical protein
VKSGREGASVQLKSSLFLIGINLAAGRLEIKIRKEK